MSVYQIVIPYGVGAGSFMFGTDPLVNATQTCYPGNAWWQTFEAGRRTGICLGISQNSAVRAIKIQFEHNLHAIGYNINLVYGTPIWVPEGQLNECPRISILAPYGLTDGDLRLLIGQNRDDFESLIYPPHSHSEISWILEEHLNEAIGAETNYKYIAAPLFPPSTNFRYVVDYYRTAAGNIPGFRIYGCTIQNIFSDTVTPAMLLNEELLVDQLSGVVRHRNLSGTLPFYYVYKICYIQNGAAGFTHGTIAIGPQP